MARLYESEIERSGGIDLQILGHWCEWDILALTSPRPALRQERGIKTLSKSTVEANKRFFIKESFSPTVAITMGNW